MQGDRTPDKPTRTPQVHTSAGTTPIPPSHKAPPTRPPRTPYQLTHSASAPPEIGRDPTRLRSLPSSGPLGHETTPPRATAQWRVRYSGVPGPASMGVSTRARCVPKAPPSPIRGSSLGKRAPPCRIKAVQLVEKPRHSQSCTRPSLPKSYPLAGQDPTAFCSPGLCW